MAKKKVVDIEESSGEVNDSVVEEEVSKMTITAGKHTYTGAFGKTHTVNVAGEDYSDEKSLSEAAKEAGELAVQLMAFNLSLYPGVPLPYHLFPLRASFEQSGCSIIKSQP